MTENSSSVAGELIKLANSLVSKPTLASSKKIAATTYLFYHRRKDTITFSAMIPVNGVSLSSINKFGKTVEDVVEGVRNYSDYNDALNSGRRGVATVDMEPSGRFRYPLKPKNIPISAPKRIMRRLKWAIYTPSLL